jgi:hypothetical protein
MISQGSPPDDDDSDGGGYAFKNKEDLRRIFTPHFKFVRVWETIYPTRHNLFIRGLAGPD